ncbi:MAG: oxidoreductase [Salinivirgaceae bacterium]|nr:oxidoreductase [Salinivirgaceae bacterium]
MNNKTAIILGASGLVGNELLMQLIRDDYFSLIKIFVRKTLGEKSNKIEEHIINFDDPESWKEKVVGDVLFSAFGTTIKKAGSKELQYKIDYSYQYQMAAIAKNNGVKSFVLVSSGGANSKSKIFYSRIKGELDCSVSKLGFENLAIIKPSILVGERKEFRFGERMAIKLGIFISKLPGVKKYRPIRAEDVAMAMIKAFKSNKKYIEAEYIEVFNWAN